MKNTWKKLLPLVLALALLLSSVSTAALAEEEPVHLKIATSTNIPNHMDEIIAAANEILLEKLNITIEVIPLGTDTSKYNLLLVTGNDVDLIYTAAWNNYVGNAMDGAYMPLRELVQTEVPELWDLIDESYWEMCEIKGEIYSIPSVSDTLTDRSLVYREDLRVKYNLPEIVDLETFEAYLAGIKENEPTMVPISVRKDDIRNMNVTRFGYREITNGITYDCKNGCIPEVYVETESFRATVEMAKKWVDNGWMDSDILSASVNNSGQFNSGKYGACIISTGSAFNKIYLTNASANPDWEIGIVGLGELFQFSTQQHPLSNSFGLPKACPHPVEALKFMYELITNRELYTLFDCGILGLDYELTEDGHYVSLSSDTNPTLTKEGMGLTGYYYSVPEFTILPVGYEFATNVYTAMRPYIVVDILATFPLDTSEFRTEATAVSQIMDQYYFPMITGMVNDVDEAIADLQQRLNDAGIQTIKEKVTAQVEEFLDK